MKNEKYIAPEMEVVEVKTDSVLMWSIDDPCPDKCKGHYCPFDFPEK